MSRVAIVTGAAGGIGAPLCRALAEDGYAVIVADFADDAGKALAEELGAKDGRALFHKIDVREKSGGERLAAAAIERYGHIDVLINAAGVISRVPTLEMPEDEWDRVLDINLKGTFLCSQAVARHMVAARSGRIVCVASGRGIAGQPRAAHYAASKAGVIALVKSFAKELAPHGVAINAIAPGATDTPMSRSGSSEEEWMKRAAVPPMMGGLTDKDEIVGLVRYLLADSARYITGQTFLLRTP
jgi:NAD(P)-dependent dehydrogenase (short-subunit alcohol dehydrogenase family)